jgi:hypothetical protein
LRLVRFGDLGLKKIGQSLDDALRENCSIMAPSPRLHAADFEVSGYLGIAAESYFERQVMPTAWHLSFEARRGYGIETHRHRPMMKYSVRAPSSDVARFRPFEKLMVRVFRGKCVHARSHRYLARRGNSAERDKRDVT